MASYHRCLWIFTKIQYLQMRCQRLRCESLKKVGRALRKGGRRGKGVDDQPPHSLDEISTSRRLLHFCEVVLILF